jgi:hypothetical protein
MVDKFRSRETYKGKNVTYKDHGESTNHLHPAFCLRYLSNSEYGFPLHDRDKKAIIIQDMYHLCQKSWQEIWQTPRDKGGKETISRRSISKTPRLNMFPDESYLSFYIGGDKGRMVGCRRGKVFYIFWFDFDFSLYKH